MKYVNVCRLWPPIEVTDVLVSKDLGCSLPQLLTRHFPDLSHLHGRTPCLNASVIVHIKLHIQIELFN